MQILAQCKEKRAEIYTQREISDILKISLRKYVDFENAKIFDFFILDQLCSLTGNELKITII